MRNAMIDKQIPVLGILRSFLKKTCKLYGITGSSLYNIMDNDYCRMIDGWGESLEENNISKLVRKPDIIGKLSGRRPALISISGHDSGNFQKILFLPVMKEDSLWGILVHKISAADIQGAVILDMLQDCADISRYYVPLLGVEEEKENIGGSNLIFKEHLPSIYLMMSPDLQILEAKGSGLQDIKMLPETLVGKQFQTIVLDGMMDQKTLMAIKGRRFAEDILIVNTVAGVRNWYRANSYPEWKNQHLERIHMIMSDINLLKNGYIENKAYKDQIEYYGNSMIDGIVLCDGDFRIIYRTASAIRVLAAYEGMREPKYMMDMLDEASSDIIKERLEQIREIAQEKWKREGTVTLNPSGKPFLRFVHKGQGTKNPSAKIQMETEIEMSISYLPAGDRSKQRFILVLREVECTDNKQRDPMGFPGMFIECNSDKIIIRAFSDNRNGWINALAKELIGKNIQNFTGQIDICKGINEIVWQVNNEKKKVLFDCDCSDDGSIKGYLTQGEWKAAWGKGSERILLEYLCESEREIVIFCDLNLNTRFVSSNVRNILKYDPEMYALMEIGLTYNTQSLNKVVELFAEGYTAMINGNLKWIGSITVDQAKQNRKWMKGKMLLAILSDGNKPFGFVIRTQFRPRTKTMKR
jgi:hypothetical protein